MIIERNEFRLHFGKAKEAIQIWKQVGEELNKDERFKGQFRLLSDLTGPAYTLVLELHEKGFNDIKPTTYYWVTNPRLQELYKQFLPLCSSSSRELYKIETEI